VSSRLRGQLDERSAGRRSAVGAEDVQKLYREFSKEAANSWGTYSLHDEEVPLGEEDVQHFEETCRM
jgi:hypothetical protein